MTAPNNLSVLVNNKGVWNSGNAVIIESGLLNSTVRFDKAECRSSRRKLPKIIRLRPDKFPMFQSFYFFGLDVDDVFDVLQAAFDHQKGFLGDYQAVGLKHGRRDDGIADAGLVFEADEHKAFGRARALAANDAAGDANADAMRGLWQIRRAPDIRQPRAEQGHGMFSGRQIHAGKIRLDAFGIVHGFERRR